MLYILLFILFIFLWLLLDFFIGRKIHINRTTLRKYPERYGNLEFFGTGKPLYDSLFKDILEAQKHIHILFYIVKDDEISKEFLRHLQKKAEEGVTVSLLLDRFGGHKLPKSEIQQLRQSGVSFAYSNKPSFPFFFYTLNYRNHRKITVIDHNIGYFGGYNIGKEYIGEDPKLGDWRDFHLKLVGDGVQDLQTEFLRDWEHATNEKITVEQKDFQKGSAKFHFLPSEGVYIHDIILKFINDAKNEIIIGTPYFIPSKKIVQALVDARKRKVNIKIIVPFRSDHALVKEAAFPFFKTLLKEGCQIYQYKNGFYHSKIIIVDERLCDIGTANFDKRSFFINKELNCFFSDQPFIKRIKNEIDKDIHHSSQLTIEEYKHRPLSQRSKEIIATTINHFL